MHCHFAPLRGQSTNMQPYPPVGGKKSAVDIGGLFQGFERRDRCPRRELTADQRKLAAIGADIRDEIEGQSAEHGHMLDRRRHTKAQEGAPVISSESCSDLNQAGESFGRIGGNPM